MSDLYHQSETNAPRRRVYLHLVGTDGITPALAEAGGHPQISQDGGAFANTAATLTAVGNGLYYVTLTAAELGTVGSFVVRYKSGATAEAQALGSVVAFDPYAFAGAGSGLISHTHTEYAVDGVTPVANVIVQASTDQGGTNPVASGTTDAFGNVTFLLNAGNYWLHRTLAGRVFTPNPLSIVVV